MGKKGPRLWTLVIGRKRGFWPVLLGYGAILGLLAAVVTMPLGGVLPTLSGGGTETPVVVRRLPLSPAMLRSLLAHGMPLMAQMDPVAVGAVDQVLWQQILGYAFAMVAGFGVSDPWSILDSAMPPLAQGRVAALARDNSLAAPSRRPPLVPVKGKPFANPANAVPPNPIPPPPDLYGRRPVVGIYHTDTQEAFFPAMRAAGLHNTYPDTLDQAVSIVQVGTYLAGDLWQQGIAVAHSRAVNDPDGQIGAYANSLVTAKTLLKAYPTLRVLLDLHRGQGSLAQTTVRIGGHRVARIQIVVGTGAYLPDPNWRVNLVFGRSLWNALHRLAPQALLPLHTSSSRYNQQVSPHALLIRIGGPNNTLAQESRSAAYLARALGTVLPKT